MAFEIFTKKMKLQKLNYLHKNPVKWKCFLAKDIFSYRFSSAKFYETGEDEFGILHDIFHEF
jgi:hypothetical protein